MSTDIQIDDELASYGVEECLCSYDDETPRCVVCGERVNRISHPHYKGQIYDDYCLLLALLRQLNQKP